MAPDLATDRVPRAASSHVGRTDSGAAGAELIHVAPADPGAAERPGWLENVGGARRGGAGADLGHVAGPGRGAADRPGLHEGVRRTGSGGAGADLGHVAVPGRGAAHRPGRGWPDAAPAVGAGPHLARPELDRGTVRDGPALHTGPRVAGAAEPGAALVASTL